MRSQPLNILDDTLISPSAHKSRLLNAQIDLIFDNLINGTLRYSYFGNGKATLFYICFCISLRKSVGATSTPRATTLHLHKVKLYISDVAGEVIKRLCR